MAGAEAVYFQSHQQMISIVTIIATSNLKHGHTKMDTFSEREEDWKEQVGEGMWVGTGF